MISVQNVEKRYGEARAVSDVSFSVQRGEIVGLLGHNGAGKTTIMKVMTGFLEPTSSAVSIDGLDVVRDRVAVQKKIGYLPENAPLYPELQVQEYLRFMADLRGLRGAERARAIDDALEATGLTQRRAQVIQTLSKGYRQRVGLAQAILHRPDVLILDEPTNGLDPVQILEIRALIERLAERATVILSTHILSEIEAVCDRVVVLIQGELVADSPLSALVGGEAVRLVVQGPRDLSEARRALSRVARAGEVSLAAPSEGGLSLRVSLREGAQGSVGDLAADLSSAAVAAGWRVLAVGPDARSLEEVFRELMRAHVARVAEGGAGAPLTSAQGSPRQASAVEEDTAQGDSRPPQPAPTPSETRDVKAQGGGRRGAQNRSHTRKERS